MSDKPQFPFSLEDAEEILRRNEGRSFDDFVRFDSQRAVVELNRQAALIAKYEAALKHAEGFIAYFLDHYGTNLEIANWHLNGDTEPLDNFLESAGGHDALDAVRNALKGETP